MESFAQKRFEDCLPGANAELLFVSCGLPDVGVPLPENAAIERAGVAAPRANKSGRPSPTCADHVAADLAGEDFWGVLDGAGSTIGIESTVLHVESLCIYRETPITAEDT
jgi:L-threonylcarbamoyladenylate synthase